MGGSSGGGARTPYEAPNTLSSAQNLRIVDAIAEGVLAGFANGDDAPFKSVFFNDTAVQNQDGSYNFKGVTGYFLRGTPEQTYVPGFDSTERTVAVSASVKRATPIVRAVTDGLVNRLRVTVGVERNVEVKSNGDSVAANTTMLVELANADGVKASQTVTFSEKGSSAFYHDVLFDVLPAAPFNIRVIRGSVDSTTDKLSNNTFFASYVEIIDAKLSYPHTAIAALKIDSDQFGNQVPRRNYLLKGKIVAVPSNYDPATRAYAGDFWDGSFKQAWTNNPAWVFYDLLTQPRYSTLARRLNVADVDKWALYGIAQYCDQLVPDGFGGQEPRFVCNAYITDQRQAGELLTDLASVFTGLPLWNGNQVSVMLDKDSDPVASYTNSNVEESGFVYASAALKAIHTAVHVRYLDKYDGYRAKTEYVADDEAVKRYGLNIKSVTAFGCDSRGQAARFGAWLLQTELRQQNAVTFTVGREGLKHLPYDIIQIADNDYAGVQMAGRVLAVSGSLITLDRDVADAVGGQLQFVAYETVDGVTRPRAKSVKVTAQPAANQLQLEHASELAELDAWVLSAKVKPRLWRAIGIKENTDEGTYTINALLHDPAKYAAVDGAANFDRDITTLHNTQPVLVNGNVGADGGAVVITWDNLSADGTVLTYDIKIMRNGKLERHIPDADSPEIRLQGLPNGEYIAEIRGRNARGVLSDPLTKAWGINYTITGLRTTPKLFAIGLAWTLPVPVVRTLHTEIWYGTENDINKAAKLAALPYPQNEYTLTGVKISDRYYFWTRIVDGSGSSGEYTASVAGVCDTDPAPIIAQITGAITESTLSRALIDQLDSKIAAGDAATAATAAAELQKEANARVADVNAARSKAASDLTARAQELGSKITAVENVNATQAQQINTVTAAQGTTAAGLEAEKKARADGDAAEASARTTLAARVTAAEGSITRNDNLRISGDKANADAIAAMGVWVGSAESGITVLQQTVANDRQAAATAQQNLSAKIDQVQADLTEQVTTRVDLSAAKYNVDTYYPVRFALSTTVKRYAFRVFAVLGRAQQDKDVAWSTHNTKTFSVNLAWQVNAYGWGTQYVDRVIDQFGFSHTAQSPVLRPDQMSNSSIEYVWLRGGASYDVTHHKTAPPQIVDASYTTANQTINTTAYNATLVPKTDQARTDAAIAVVSADLSSYKSAQATKDAAQTTEINAAKSRLGSVEAGVTSLQTTVANNQSATATSINKLQSGMTAGGNLVAGGDFRDPAAWRSHYGGTDISSLFLSDIPSSPTPPYCFGRAIGNCYNYSNTDVTIAQARTYRFSAWFNNSGNADGIFGFNWRRITGDKGYAGKVVSVPLGWHYREVIMTESEFGASIINPGFFVNHTGTVGRGYIADYKFEDITDQQNLSASITETKSTVTALSGKVQGLYSLQVQAVGARKAVAGLALGADGATGDSQMLVMADKFALVRPGTQEIQTPFVVSTVNGATKLALAGDLYADGTILGKHIAANQTITAPVINGGSLNIGGGRFSVNGSGQVNISAQAGNVGLKVTNERIEVYDANGVLRVRLGKLT